MPSKVILVVLDGLSHSVAQHAMGHLHAWCDAGRAAFYRLDCELPALSRPLYEAILTGVRPIDSGIVHNDVSRLSRERSMFHYARDAGLSTAAAAYHWVSELYNRSPFVAVRDRHTCDESLPIQHGHSITPTTTRTRTCSSTPRACVCSTRQTCCWCTR